MTAKTKRGLEKGSWKTYGGGGRSEEGTDSTDRPGSQLPRGEITPTNPLLKPLPFAPSSELGMFWAGMLKQVMFTCTSKAINNKPVGLRWVCGPSHLGLTSWKHLASFCHNSIQIHFGPPQAPPVLVEVIPDYRATVVKCWYNVFFFLFFHSPCLRSCSGTAGRLVVLHFHRLLCKKLTSHFRFIYMKYAQLGPGADRALSLSKVGGYETRSCPLFRYSSSASRYVRVN